MICIQHVCVILAVTTLMELGRMVQTHAAWGMTVTCYRYSM